MEINPHNRISTKHQKCRGPAPEGCRKILNKREGGTLYQKTNDSLFFIPRPFRTICKKPGPTRINTTILLWIMPAQDTTHDIRNAKQVAKKMIFIRKTDLNAAYRRIHINDTTVPTCISIVDELAFICLQLPFGATPAPEEYMTAKEAAIDLGKNLLQEESWDTKYLNSLHRSLLTKEDKQQMTNHLVHADPLVVDITVIEASMDGFIVDIITITADDKHWI